MKTLWTVFGQHETVYSFHILTYCVFWFSFSLAVISVLDFWEKKDCTSMKTQWRFAYHSQSHINSSSNSSLTSRAKTFLITIFLDRPSCISTSMCLHGTIWHCTVNHWCVHVHSHFSQAPSVSCTQFMLRIRTVLDPVRHAVLYQQITEMKGLR